MTVIVAFSLEGRAPARPPAMSPLEYMDFSLVRPFRRIFHEAMPNRIAPHILPFLIVTIFPSQLTVPKIALPKLPFAHRLQLARRERLPISNPCLQITLTNPGWRTKKMDVVRQNHIRPHLERIGGRPRRNNSVMHFGCSKQWAAVLRAHRHKVNNGCLHAVESRVMNGMFSLREPFLHGPF